ncbi:MAG: DUF1552 domain-containing protein [Verrucomicrobiales bacterium]|nr:DUF1552 domain-containing protein [Verrucomicrobiales bacterium]
MNTPHIATRNALSRRHFLKGTGATIFSLPVLEAMTPAFAKSGAVEAPPRFVAMCATLGFHTPYLFPEQSGRDYELTPYLEKLKDHRDQFTVISGTSHPSQQGNNGHASEMTWLTSAQRPGLAGFKNTISLDQLIAEKIGVETRYPYLALSTTGRSLSWTSTGVEIPTQSSPSKLFKALFVEGTEDEVAAEMRELKRGRSILDTVLGEARKLESDLGPRDREKLDEYLTSVRDLEVRLQQNEGWVQKPKPKVDAKAPKDVEDRHDAIAKQRLMNDMIVLALQTDSTRSVTFQLGGMNAVPSNIPGVKTDWHNLSHHGKDPDKIEELKIIEEAEFTVLNEFLTKLDGISENGKTLLDRTAVLYGSNLGNASSHSSKNVPLVLAGGGYRHGQHLAMKIGEKEETPLSNLFVSLAQRMGVEIDQFGTSTKSGLDGLELA